MLKLVDCPNIDAAFQLLQQSGYQQGFNLIMRNVRYGEEPIPNRRRVWLNARCKLDGDPDRREKHSDPAKQIARKSNRIQCPFHVSLSCPDGSVKVGVKCDYHNHLPRFAGSKIVAEPFMLRSEDRSELWTLRQSGVSSQELERRARECLERTLGTNDFTVCQFLAFRNDLGQLCTNFGYKLKTKPSEQSPIDLLAVQAWFDARPQVKFRMHSENAELSSDLVSFLVLMMQTTVLDEPRSN
jgi:hypothetical protein